MQPKRVWVLAVLVRNRYRMWPYWSLIRHVLEEATFISHKYCKVDITKNAVRHQHIQNQQSRISFLALIGACQHSVAQTCNDSVRANIHIFQPNPYTLSSSELWSHLGPYTCTATSCVLGCRKTKWIDR